MTKQKAQVKKGNGRWVQSFVDEVLAYAEKYSNIEAIRKYDVPPATFYGWLRRAEYAAK